MTPLPYRQISESLPLYLTFDEGINLGRSGATRGRDAHRAIRCQHEMGMSFAVK